MGVSPQQLKQMQERLSGASRKPVPAFQPLAIPAAQSQRIIIGIDPSLRGTGYGVIQLARPHFHVLAHGSVSCPAGWRRSRCLARISQTLREIVRQHQPVVCVIEGLFYAQNLQTALLMGEARGAALAVVAEAGLEIFEIAPRKVKQAIVGFGGAQKLAVAKMVQRLLQLPEAPAPDAADALALALAYAQSAGRSALNAPRQI